MCGELDCELLQHHNRQEKAHVAFHIYNHKLQILLGEKCMLILKSEICTWEICSILKHNRCKPLYFCIYTQAIYKLDQFCIYVQAIYKLNQFCVYVQAIYKLNQFRIYVQAIYRLAPGMRNFVNSIMQ